jgi:hypothetical protein
MIATVVDTGKLLQVVEISLAAGIGLSAAFSFVIYGAARASDMRRAERGIAAGALALLAGVALLACIAAVGFGVHIMLKK